MKTLKYVLIFALSTLLLSCVSSKKYKTLNSAYDKSAADAKDCQDALSKSTDLNNELVRKNKDLTDQLEEQKKNSNQMMNTLQDMSVLSGKQAESVKQSLQTLSEKESYIKDLQSALRRKDSLNLALVMNLKKGLADVNDSDVNIKVEKGVIYIDISDKMLFNSGQYNVTEKAKGVLGKIATVLNTHPDLDVMVEGHTDSVAIHTPILSDNWDLSVKRATSVVRILQTKYNINPVRMTAAGRGDYVPVASNKTKEGRSLNRRTRIIVLPQLDQFFKMMVNK